MLRMLQALLADRFKLAIRREKKRLSALVSLDGRVVVDRTDLEGHHDFAWNRANCRSK